MSNSPALPSMNLTSALARPKRQEENRLEGKMLQGGSLDWFKRSLKSAGARPVRGSRRFPLGSVSVEATQETSEILSLLMLKGEFPSLSGMTDL